VLSVDERDRHRLEARIRVAGRGCRDDQRQQRDEDTRGRDARQWMYPQMTQPWRTRPTANRCCDRLALLVMCGR
jgi:hypothetical protein